MKAWKTPRFFRSSHSITKNTTFTIKVVVPKVSPVSPVMV